MFGWRVSCFHLGEDIMALMEGVRTMLMFNRPIKFLLIVLFMLRCGEIHVRAESRIPFLVVAGKSYTNVVVLQKTADDVFIQHNGGIASFKVTDMNDALRSQLGLPLHPVMTNLTSSVSITNSALAGNPHREPVPQPAQEIAGKNSRRVSQSTILEAAGILVLAILLSLSVRNSKRKETRSPATAESHEPANV